MKSTYPCITLTLGTTNFGFSSGFMPNEEDKPNYGDIFVNLKSLQNRGCLFKVMRSSGVTVKHKTISKSLNEHDNVYRLRLGEVFMAKGPEDQIFRFFRLVDEDDEPTYFTDNHLEDPLPEYRLNAMRESQRVRHSRTDKMRNEEQKKLPPVAGKHSSKRRRPLTHRLIAAFNAFRGL